MSKRELITQAINRLSEEDLDRLLAFLQIIAKRDDEASIPATMAESVLARDWLAPEEDAAWASL